MSVRNFNGSRRGGSVDAPLPTHPIRKPFRPNVNGYVLRKKKRKKEVKPAENLTLPSYLYVSCGALRRDHPPCPAAEMVCSKAGVERETGEKIPHHRQRRFSDGDGSPTLWVRLSVSHVVGCVDGFVTAPPPPSLRQTCGRSRACIPSNGGDLDGTNGRDRFSEQR